MLNILAGNKNCSATEASTTVAKETMKCVIVLSEILWQTAQRLQRAEEYQQKTDAGLHMFELLPSEVVSSLFIDILYARSLKLQ